MAMNDKTLHFLACGVIAAVMAAVMLLTGATTLQTAVAAIGTSMAAGLAKEYGDRCAIGNHWDWYDLAADLAGAIIGTAIAAGLGWAIKVVF